MNRITYLKRIMWPPSLLARQFCAVLLYANLSQWRLFADWVGRHGLRSIPIAAGAKGMGCIGYPDHPVWEVTARCNLSCVHCHVSAGDDLGDELNTEEGKQLIDELRLADEFRVLVYSGGEPMVRKDILELMDYSWRRGFINILATNGTLIDRGVARELKKRGLRGAAVSIDSSELEVHNRIRNSRSAFDLAARGIEALSAAGIPVQINVTAMEYNFPQLGTVLELAERYNAVILLMYQLVPVGRGDAISSASLTAGQNERLIRFLAQRQRHVTAIVEPVAGPQYWPYLLSQGGAKPKWMHWLAGKVFHGCCAGRGFVYLKANGEVWACPFINISAGNIRQRSFLEIWRESGLFTQLRNRDTLLKGKCGECRFKRICGGCRGRALAYTNDLMAEDPTCFLKGEG